MSRILRINILLLCLFAFNSICIHTSENKIFKNIPIKVSNYKNELDENGTRNGNWMIPVDSNFVEQESQDGAYAYRFCNYNHGILEGITTTYYHSGSLAAQGFAKHGMWDGEVKEYYPNSKLKKLEIYDEGILNGPWYKYHANGNVLLDGYFDFGKRSGLWKTFDINGKAKVYGRYLNDKRAFTWFYFENGILKKIEFNIEGENTINDKIQYYIKKIIDRSEYSLASTYIDSAAVYFQDSPISQFGLNQIRSYYYAKLGDKTKCDEYFQLALENCREIPYEDKEKFNFFSLMAESYNYLGDYPTLSKMYDSLITYISTDESDYYYNLLLYSKAAQLNYDLNNKENSRRIVQISGIDDIIDSTLSKGIIDARIFDNFKEIAFAENKASIRNINIDVGLTELMHLSALFDLENNEIEKFDLKLKALKSYQTTLKIINSRLRELSADYNYNHISDFLIDQLVAKRNNKSKDR